MSGRSDDAPAAARGRRRPETLSPDGGEHLDRPGVIVTAWSKRSTTAGGGAASARLRRRRRCCVSVACAEAAPGNASASAATRETTPHRGRRRARERCPKIGATSRSQKSITASTTHVIAKPARQTTRRGCSDWPSGKIAATSERPADRVVEERRAGEEPWVLLVDQEGGGADEQRERERERPPAARAASRARARAGPRRRASPPRPTSAWASMCSVEFVKKTATGHSSTPIANAIDGHRYSRQRRIAKTSLPTIASASRISPSRRKPAAKAQWTSSALGAIGGAEILDQTRVRSRGRRAARRRSRAAAAGRGSRRSPCRRDRRRRCDTAGRSPRRRRRGWSGDRATRSRARGPTAARPPHASGARSSGPTISELTQPPRFRPYDTLPVCRPHRL